MSADAQNALAQLRHLITSSDLGEGGQLPTERALAEELGVSRRALRAALEVLEEEGLVWRRQGKGTFIGQPPDPHGKIAADIVQVVDAQAIMEARLCVEPALAELAAARATPADVEQMRRLVDHIGLSPATETAELWDGALHRMIARVAGNPILLTAFQLIDELRIREDWQALRERARSAASMAKSDHEHRTMIDAIEAGDGAKARRCMETHLTRLAGTLVTSNTKAEAAS
ncbi:FadR/GntR family transcriptional regulator [Thioclava atlantica]|uniref:Transcriptional regulator, GntR family protein n=1 Tax=Thioclava atlantica TaxID=1317124 RepID=A0A085TW27_9RHOB|nr:FCD domain-containing protein [Thioclava atlantica]KFE34924.1 transcriptional regulator, GntR family protein [Thioclava atlantica]